MTLYDELPEKCHIWSSPGMDTFPLISPNDYLFTLTHMKDYDLTEKIPFDQEVLDSQWSNQILEIEYVSFQDILEMGNNRIDPLNDKVVINIEPLVLVECLPAESKKSIDILVSIFNDAYNYIFRKFQRVLGHHHTIWNNKFCREWVDQMKEICSYVTSYFSKYENPWIAVGQSIEDFDKAIDEMKNDFMALDASIIEQGYNVNFEHSTIRVISNIDDIILKINSVPVTDQDI